MKDEDKTKEELIKELKLLREEQEKGAFKDIGEHKQTEKTLHESEKKWRSLVSVLPDYVSLLDLEGRFLFLNHYAEGFTEKEVIGSSVYQYFSTQSKEIFAKEIAECQNTGKIRKFEHTAMGDHGIMREYEDYLVPLLEKNKVTSTLVISRDITERKQAVESLRTERQRLYNVLEVMPMMVCLLTPDYHVPFANRAFREKFGESNGRHCYEYCFGKKEPCDFCESYEVLKTGKPHRWEVISPDGATIIDVHDFSFTDVDGSPMILEVDVDITEHKQAEEALKKANLKLQELDQVKSIFIASMGHELKTPLTLILSCTGIMLQEMSGEINKEQRKQLTLVEKNANHLLDLTNDAIDINKIEAGIVDITIGEFDLSALSREIKDSFMITADKKELILSLETPPTLIIESDRRRIKQILVNLLGNALKFTDKGEIKIKIAAKDQTVEIAVRDSGIGIKKEDRDKVFIAFVQIPNPNRITEGTGLGLYLSKKNAHLLGGDITVESELGKGSVFTLTLPLKYKEDKA